MSTKEGERRPQLNQFTYIPSRFLSLHSVCLSGLLFGFSFGWTLANGSNSSNSSKPVHTANKAAAAAVQQCSQWETFFFSFLFHFEEMTEKGASRVVGQQQQPNTAGDSTSPRQPEFNVVSFFPPLLWWTEANLICSHSFSSSKKVSLV